MERNPTDTMIFIAFYRQRRVVSNLWDNAECNNYLDKLHEHKKNYKIIFDLCNGLLGCDRDLPLPSSHSEQE